MSAKFSAVAQDDVQVPVYSDTTVENQVSPPEYNSLFGKLKQAKADASNPVDFVSKSSSILCGSAVATVALFISAVVPIACIVIGVMRKDDCTIQSYIPLWLIVSGACGLFTAVVKALTNLAAVCRKRNGEEKQGAVLNALNCLNGIVGLFCFGWFIAGNVWVYSNYNKVVYDTFHSPLYCDRLVYLFAFWVITASWISLGLACCCICGLVACALGVAGLISRSK